MRSILALRFRLARPQGRCPLAFALLLACSAAALLVNTAAAATPATASALGSESRGKPEGIAKRPAPSARKKAMSGDSDLGPRMSAIPSPSMSATARLRARQPAPRPTMSARPGRSNSSVASSVTMT
mgnify:CR=1 FL=1